MRVASRRRGRGMTKPDLDQAQIDPGFQQMGRPRMPQGVDSDMLLKAALSGGCLHGCLRTARQERVASEDLPNPASCGKEPDGMAVRPPVGTEQGKKLRSKGDKAVFA